jgi:hypothetical protein
MPNTCQAGFSQEPKLGGAMLGHATPRRHDHPRESPESNGLIAEPLCAPPKPYLYPAAPLQKGRAAALRAIRNLSGAAGAGHPRNEAAMNGDLATVIVTRH